MGGKWPDFLWNKLKLGSVKGKPSTTEIEFRALIICLERWKGMIGGDEIYIFQDNLGVINALRKGKSPSYFVNQQILRALPLLGSSHWRMTYIASKKQLADYNSRHWGDGKENEILLDVANCVDAINNGRWEELLSPEQVKRLGDPDRAPVDGVASSNTPIKRQFEKWMSGFYPCSRTFYSLDLP